MNNNIFIAGHNGMVGRAVNKRLNGSHLNSIFTSDRKSVDLANLKQFEDFVLDNNINEIIFCAAKVGGIKANNENKFEFLYENSVMQNNLFYIVRKHKIKKLTFLGSSCIYPRDCKQPIKEEYMLSGSLEETNDAYALAKISGVKFCEILNQSSSFDCRALMPTNIYGYHDNFSIDDSHVIPGLIRKFYEAKNNNNDVEIWGTGKPFREFMFSEDLGDAISFIHSMKKSDFYKITGPKSLINIGSGDEMQIKDVAKMIADIFDFRGNITFNSSYPDGTPRKKLDLTLLDKTGWKKSYSIEEGLKNTIDWFSKNFNSIRK